MQDYILFSDLHLGIHSSADVYLEMSLKLATAIIKYAKEKNINKILHLGDFFNDRRSLNLKVLDTAVKFANKFEEAELELILLCGNHDLYLKNSLFPNSLCIFEKYKYIRPVTELTVIDDCITLVPWSTSFEDATTPFLAGHFEINGFDVESSEGFEYSAKDFKKFSKVFSGHFHNPKTSGNIEYIGSVMPFTMHDVDSPRGFYHISIDGKQCKEKFIEFTEAPKYKIIFSDQEIKEDDIKGNVVKLVYVNELSSVENENLLAKIAQFNPVQVAPDFKNIVPLEINPEEQETNLDPSEVKNALTLFYEFLNKVNKPSYIKEEVAKNFVKQLLQEN